MDPTPPDSCRAAEALARYCRAIDGGDPELLAAVFAEDMVLERADGSVHSGRTAVVDLFRASVPAPPALMRHQVTNVEVVTADALSGNAFPGAATALARYWCAVLQSTGPSRVTVGSYRAVLATSPAGTVRLHRLQIVVDAVLAVPADAVTLWSVAG